MRTPSTTTISLGDVLLVQVAFTDLSGSMKRPAIVVSNDEYNESGFDAVIVPLTSRTSYCAQGIIALATGQARVWREHPWLEPSPQLSLAG